MKLQDVTKKLHKFLEGTQLNLLLDSMYIRSDALDLVETCVIEEINIKRDYAEIHEDEYVYFPIFELTLLINGKRGTVHTAERDLFGEDVHPLNMWSICNSLSFENDERYDTFFYNNEEFDSIANTFGTSVDAITGFFEAFTTFGIHRYLEYFYRETIITVMERLVSRHQNSSGNTVTVTYELDDGKNLIPYLIFNSVTDRERVRLDESFYDYTIKPNEEITEIFKTNPYFAPVFKEY